MKISKYYYTPLAYKLINNNMLAWQACNEIKNAICSVTWPSDSQIFSINNSQKNCNGVVPIKDPCYQCLEYTYQWFREKPLEVLKNEKQKGGPIDVYKEFLDKDGSKFRVGLEFETGNISSAHRSLNKLILGLNRKELDLAAILLPVKALAYYLTDRVANYEELEPYFEITNKLPFVFIGFNADTFDNKVAFIPKGKDGMSHRNIRKWMANKKA